MPAKQKMIGRYVDLNGTDTNPYERWGLRCNPFPQLARYEWTQAEMALNTLGGEPLKGPEDIRSRLAGVGFDGWFIDGLCERFRKGVMVRVHLHWPES